MPRQFKGFLVETHGKESRVAFIDNGKTVFYDIPTKCLRAAKITAKNQPFEMSEIKTASGVDYIFVALAKASDARKEPLQLDAERKRKLELILKEWE